MANYQNQLNRLNDEQAARVYDALIKHCGAAPREDDIAGFVHEFTRPNPTNEYRFQGGLGFGGKFRFPYFTVDCYPEDENAARNAMVAAGNEALAQLLAEFTAAPR